MPLPIPRSSLHKSRRLNITIFTLSRAEGREVRGVEILGKFVVMEMNVNVLWENTGGDAQVEMDRMNRLWGDDSWRSASYRKEDDQIASHEAKARDEGIGEG